MGTVEGQRRPEVRDLRRSAGLGAGLPAAAACLVLATSLPVLLSGCGRATAPAGARAAGTQAGAGAAASASTGANGANGGIGEGAQAGDSAPASDADLVSAVNVNGEARPISVKFRVEARPVVGMPVKILLALIPDDQAQIAHVHGSVSAAEGLLIQSATSFDLSDLRSGAPQYREITVLPQQTGVLDLEATLLLQMDTATEARTYSIPLIVADNSSP